MDWREERREGERERERGGEGEGERERERIYKIMEGALFLYVATEKSKFYRQICCILK
jgi:hypothetical protein